jgi:hypothetical protein
MPPASCTIKNPRPSKAESLILDPELENGIGKEQKSLSLTIFQRCVICGTAEPVAIRGLDLEGASSRRLLRTDQLAPDGRSTSCLPLVGHQPPSWSRPVWLEGRRCLDHADDHFRQHQRAMHHDRREMRGYDAGGCLALRPNGIRRGGCRRMLHKETRGAPCRPERVALEDY